MANATRGFYEIHIGGQTRQLRYRTQEVCELESLLGMGMGKIFSEDMMGMRIIRDCIMIGVKHEFAGKNGKTAQLSRQKVSRWMDQYFDEGGDLESLGAMVMQAVASALPDGVKKGEQQEEDDEDSPLT